MKDDLGPAPDAVPTKRVALKRAPDLWVAQWLARDGLSAGQRKKLEDEKRRRREGGPPVVVGFTGSREGMTPQQRRVVEEIVRGATEAHHGDCVGADETFHWICRRAGVPVVGHPPEGNRLRAFCDGFARVEPSKPFLERNKDIVQAATLVVATPKDTREPARVIGEGTWATVRYARGRPVALRVVMPDGQLLGEGAGT